MLTAAQGLSAIHRDFLIDGHSCLMDAELQVTRLPIATCMALSAAAIILLIEDPSLIVDRRRLRDGIKHEVAGIRRFQDEEAAYSAEIAESLGVPYRVVVGTDDWSDGLYFMRDCLERRDSGG